MALGSFRLAAAVAAAAPVVAGQAGGLDTGRLAVGTVLLLLVLIAGAAAIVWAKRQS